MLVCENVNFGPKIEQSRLPLQHNSVQLKVLHIVSMKFVSSSAIGVAPMLVVAHRNADSKCQQKSSERKINI